MGVRNLRAICPKCGGKMHTQPKGLGHLSLWANSWVLVQTGSECQWYGVALTGKVNADGRSAFGFTKPASVVLGSPTISAGAAVTFPRCAGSKREVVAGPEQPVCRPLLRWRPMDVAR
jgi:hypothetical protein